MIPITPALLDMFPDVMRVKPVLTRAVTGTPLTFGAEIEVPVKLVSGDITLVKDRSGKERQTRSRAIVCGNYGITTEYVVTYLPPRFLPQIPEIVAVDQPSDENGPHHQVVRFG